jgi:hypothetical protein
MLMSLTLRFQGREKGFCMGMGVAVAGTSEWGKRSRQGGDNSSLRIRQRLLPFRAIVGRAIAAAVALCPTIEAIHPDR